MNTTLRPYEGPFEVHVTSKDDKWQMVGYAFDLQIENEPQFETIYSEWDYSPRMIEQSATITLTARMNAYNLKMLTGGALAIPESSGSEAVEKLRSILSG